MKKKIKYTEQERTLGRMLSNVDGKHLLNNHRYVVSSGPRDRSGKSYFQKAIAEALVKAGFKLHAPKAFKRTDTPDRVVFRGFHGGDFPNPTDTRRIFGVESIKVGVAEIKRPLVFINEAEKIDWEKIKEFADKIPSLQHWQKEQAEELARIAQKSKERYAVVTRDSRVFRNIVMIDRVSLNTEKYYRIDDVQQVCGMEWAKCYVPKDPLLYFPGMTEIIQHMERRNVEIIYI